MKKRISKRILSTLLVLVMVLSALPMAALAAEFKGIDVDADGVNDVNVGFGAELDPNSVLTQYDIKAVGAVVMDYVGGERKVKASGEVELYVPFSMFEDTIDDKLDDKLSSALKDVVDPAVQEYKDKVAEYLAKPISFTDEFEVEIYPNDFDPAIDEDVCIEELTITVDVSNLAALIELIRSGTYPVEYAGVSFNISFSEMFGDADDALREMVDYAVTEEFGVSKLTGAAYDNWLAEAADPTSDADALAESLAAVLGLKYAQKEYDNATVKVLIGNISLDNNGVFKNSTQIAAELKAEIEEDVADMVDGYVQPLLTDIKAAFYGPLADGETLTDRFDDLQTVIDTFIDDISEDFADYGAAGLTGVEVPMPTDKIGSMEGMLKSVVAKMNDTNAADEEITGAVIGGDEQNDALAARSTTGLYVVVGVDSANTSDMKYEAYVVAPEVVPVTIKADGADKGYFMHYTVGDDYEITSSVPSGYDAENPMKLRIVGVETDGGTYDSEEEPANAGVYTVFSFYLDKDTMAMGGDVAVLVVEPQETPDNEYAFTGDLTVSYDGEGHFPGIVNTNNHMSVSIAADRNNADVYVLLPDNFGDTVGVYTERAEDILERIESETENVGLPLPEQITAKILGALTALDNYANAAEGPRKVTNQQIKDRLNNYLTAVKDLYSTETLVEKAGNVVAKVKEVLKTNPTVQGYKDLIKYTLDEFKSFKDQSMSTFALRRSTMSNEERIAREFVNRFVDEADVSEDDVRALLSYVADYADNSSYKQDAITLIKTLGAIGKVETDKVNAAVDNVDAAFDVLKADVKAKLIEINNRADKVPTKADAKAVLGYVETFIKAVEEQAKAVVKAFTVQNIYFGIEPSAVGVYDCYTVNVSANYVPNLSTAELTIAPSKYVCWNVDTGVFYEDLSDALKLVNGAETETIQMLKDWEENYVLIAPGTTLDLADCTVEAKFLVGMNGSYLTANPNSGKLIPADKKNVTLAKEAYKNEAGNYVLPVWDSDNGWYVFSQFALNTDPEKDRGLTVDEANEKIRFQFKHLASSSINKGLIAEKGSRDCGFDVVVRLEWVNDENGYAFQNFVYKDELVKKVAGSEGVAYDYFVILTGYTELEIDLSNVKVTAMIITDSGAVAYGETWTASMAKDNG